MRRVQTHVGTLSNLDGKNNGNKQRNKTFARMSSNNPYLGTFHHAPPAGNVGAKYFNMQIITEEELQKQKAYRNNPHTGTFHPFPQNYSKLHHSKFKLKNKRSSATNKPTKLKRVSIKAAQAVQIQQSKMKRENNMKTNITISNTWKTWKPKPYNNNYDNNINAYDTTNEDTIKRSSMLEMKVANKNNNTNDRLSSSVPRKQHTSLTNFKFDREDNNNNNNTIDAKNTTILFRRQKSNSDTSHLLNFAARASTSTRRDHNSVEHKTNNNNNNKNSTTIVAEEEKKTPSSSSVVGAVKNDNNNSNNRVHLRIASNTTMFHGSEQSGQIKSHSSPHLSNSSMKKDDGNVFDVAVNDKEGRKQHRKNFSVNLPVGRDKFSNEKNNNNNNKKQPKEKKLKSLSKDHVSPVLRYLDRKKTKEKVPSIDSLMGGSSYSMDFTDNKTPGGNNDNNNNNKSTEDNTSSTLFSRRKVGSKVLKSKLSPSITTIKASSKRNQQEVLSPKAETFDQLKPWFIHHSQIQDIYELEQYAAGYGTYSQVYRGKHMKLGGQFAIKTINKRYLISEEEKQSVRREIEVQLRFHHPNIIRLYEVYEEAEKLHLVMEHATEGTLAESMPRKVSERRACKIIYQLLVAVSHLHENGILHSDIKPDNVLLNKAPPLSLPSTSKHTLAPERKVFDGQLDELDIFNDDGRVQLCDFGLSRKVPDIKYFRHTGDVHKVPFTGICGSPGYFAPELLRKEAYGKQTDLWSVGIIMYELIFGFSPFRPYHKCLDQPLEFSEKYPISEEAKQLLMQLLVVQPSKRINAKKALQNPWFNKYGFIKFKNGKDSLDKYV